MFEFPKEGIPLFLSREVKQAYIDLGFSMAELRNAKPKEIIETLVQRGKARYVGGTSSYFKSKAQGIKKNKNRHTPNPLDGKEISKAGKTVKADRIIEKGRKDAFYTAKDRHFITGSEQNKTKIDVNSYNQKQRRANVKRKMPEATRYKNAEDVSTISERQKIRDTGPVSSINEKNTNKNISIKKKDIKRPENIIRPETKYERIKVRKLKKFYESRAAKLELQQVLANRREALHKFVNKSQTFLRSPWTRRAVAFGASVIAFNMISDAWYRLTTPKDQRAIPSEYERGYSIIKDRITDFGSPVNLSRATQKVIMPKYSHVREGLITTVDSVINRNHALRGYNNAINHMRY